MARYRQRLQESLEIPVVAPSQAAVSMAVSALLLDYLSISKKIMDKYILFGRND